MKVLGHEVGFWESLVILLGTGACAYFALAISCWLWPEYLWPRITCKKIVDVERLDEKLSVEVKGIVKFNDSINRSSIITNPTYDDIDNEKPRVVLRTRVSGSEKLKESTFEFDKRCGNWWVREGWDGDPADLRKTRRTTVYIVPSDRDYSYITAEIWHWRACNRRQLRKEKKAGQIHRHGGRCKLIYSEEHVTWHIRKS